MNDNLAAIASRALALVDLTNLNESCSPADIDELCRRAVGALWVDRGGVRIFRPNCRVR